MKFFKIALMLICFSAIGASASVVELEKGEIALLIGELLKKDCGGWINKGTIEAELKSYKKQTGETKVISESVVCDGDKYNFHSEILEYYKDLDDALDKTAPKLDLKRNRLNSFVWDGQKYTIYFESVGHAIVFEDVMGLPVSKNQLRKAGYISWGIGALSQASLSKANIRGYKDDSTGRDCTRLVITLENSYELEMLMDDALNYAPLSYVIKDDLGNSMVTNYRNYSNFDGRWVPGSVLRELYQNTELFMYDYWDMTYHNNGNAAFAVDFKDGDYIEYKPFGAKQKIFYNFSKEIDTQNLILKKIESLVNNSSKLGNCAVSGMDYLLSKFDMELEPNDIDNSEYFGTELTNLAQLINLASKYQLKSQAVKMDLKALEELRGFEVLFYLPGLKHFVALGAYNDDKIWVVDLSSDKIVKMYRVGDFMQQWGEGVALLVSKNEQASLPANVLHIPEAELAGICGGSVQGYTCTKVIQEYTVEFCSEPIGLMCGGQYRMWYHRKGCERSTTPGTCVGTKMPGNTYSYCILDVDNLSACDTSDQWETEYIRACE